MENSVNQVVTSTPKGSGLKNVFKFIPALAVLAVIAGGAFLGANLVQRPAPQKSFACISCPARTCPDGWSFGADSCAPQASCNDRYNEACRDHQSKSGGSGSGGSTSGGSGSSFNQAACTSACRSAKGQQSGGVVSGRKNTSKNEFGLKDCECYCSSGSWNSSFSACVGSGGSSGGAGTGGGSNSTQNKSAGASCNPQAAGGLPQNGGCDGSGPLSCIVCPGGTSKSGQNVCSGFTSGQEVAGDCGGYTTGNTSSPSEPVGDTSQTCNSSSASNCGGKKVGSTCIASGNATGYCSVGSGLTTCSCPVANNDPLTIGNQGTCESNQWKVYECNSVNTSSGCQDKVIGTVDGADAADRLLSQTPSCKTRQADCVNGSSLVFKSTVNNPGSCYSSGEGGGGGGTTGTGGGGTNESNGTGGTNVSNTGGSTEENTFYCSSLVPSANEPKIGDTVNFTCQAAGLGLDQVNRYDFQYRVDDGAFTQMGISSIQNNVSVGLVVTEPGTYEVQCRACSSTVCTEWDTL